MKADKWGGDEQTEKDPLLALGKNFSILFLSISDKLQSLHDSAKKMLDTLIE